MPTMPDPQDWSYSGDPATSDLDEVRYLVQDTDSDVRLLSDAEITYEIAKWTPKLGSNTGIAFICAQRVAAKFAGVTDIAADGVRVALGDLQEKYTALAVVLRSEYERDQVGEINLDNLMVGAELDDDIEPLSFGVGMHDNIEAGAQNYGGRRPRPADRDDFETFGGI